MNQQLRTLYAAIKDNEVVCFETNLADFRKQFAKIEPGIYHYRTLTRKFLASPKFQLTLSDKTYYFQKLV